jgi:hypothetical protein
MKFRQHTREDLLGTIIASPGVFEVGRLVEDRPDLGEDLFDGD